ncbi:MAG: 30S ribosomal protein S3 [bacterium]|nr:30S ribosomal protein S3 [bacterium]
MSHVVHPYSHRLGIIRDWKSRWFNLNKYKEFLRGDILIRELLQKKLRGMYVSGVEIERSEKILRVIIKTSRPGMIIGRNGEGAQKLKDELLSFISKKGLTSNQELKLDIEEVRSPESNAMIVAQMVAEALEKRMPFRRVVKQMVEKVMANRDVSGVKIVLSGRLGGAEMARREKILRGRIPLQTFRADIDFARYEANMSYGNIGIKVWIYRGEVFQKK